MTRAARLVTFGILVVGLCGSMGCLVSSDKKTEQTGQVVDRSAFSRIKPGKTSAEFTEATLGTPTAKTDLGDGSEIWRWTSTERTDGSGAVFLLYAGTTSKEKVQSAYVQVRDGVVQKKWRD